MSKKLTNRLSILMGTSLILLLCVVMILPIKASAEEEIKCIEYPDEVTIGVEVNGSTPYKTNTKFQLSTDKHSRMIIYFEVDSLKNTGFYLANSADKILLATKEDFKCEYDEQSKRFFCTYALNTNGEKYDLHLVNGSKGSISYCLLLLSEPQIKLSATTISGITNTKSHTMTVKYAPVKKRLGYQIEYADNSKFNNKARVNTGATTKSIGKLTIGKTYYVRVRSYGRYCDGTLVYSKWSGTRKIKIRK